MTKFLRLLLATAPLLGFAGAAVAVSAPAHADTITIGLDDESYPPFYSKAPSGKWVGWELDLLKAVCDQMKAECKTKEIAWDGLIPALQQKQIDMIWASLTINGDRRKVIDFTQMYYNSPIVMVGSKDDSTAVDCGKLETFKGKVVGVQSGTIFSTYMKSAPADVQVKTYDTTDNMLADLANGRIDYAQEGVSTFAEFLKKNTDYAVKTTCPGNDVLGYGVGGGVRKGDTALRDRVSAAIMELVKNGTWDAITAKYPVLNGMITKP